MDIETITDDPFLKEAAEQATERNAVFDYEVFAGAYNALPLGGFLRWRRSRQTYSLLHEALSLRGLTPRQDYRLFPDPVDKHRAVIQRLTPVLMDSIGRVRGD